MFEPGYEDAKIPGAILIEGLPGVGLVAKVAVAYLIDKLNGKRILFCMEGKKTKLEEVLEEEVVCIIGGFPSGDFLSPVYEFANEKISLYDEMLPAWIVEMEAIVAYEKKFLW